MEEALEGCWDHSHHFFLQAKKGKLTYILISALSVWLSLALFSVSLSLSVSLPFPPFSLPFLYIVFKKPR